MAAYTQNYNERVEALVSSCKVMPSDFNGNQFPVYNVDTAVWDTGATHTIISPEIVEALQLKPIGSSEVSGLNVAQEAKVYCVDVLLPTNNRVCNLIVTAMPIGDYEMIVGMDIISLGDFCFTNKDGKSCFSFRLPSSEHIELQ